MDGMLSQDEINALLNGGIPDAPADDAAAGAPSDTSSAPPSSENC